MAFNETVLPKVTGTGTNQYDLFGIINFHLDPPFICDFLGPNFVKNTIFFL
jgi:hypothetical protein